MNCTESLHFLVFTGAGVGSRSCLLVRCLQRPPLEGCALPAWLSPFLLLARGTGACSGPGSLAPVAWVPLSRYRKARAAGVAWGPAGPSWHSDALRLCVLGGASQCPVPLPDLEARRAARPGGGDCPAQVRRIFYMGSRKSLPDT